MSLTTKANAVPQALCDVDASLSASVGFWLKRHGKVRGHYNHSAYTSALVHDDHTWTVRQGLSRTTLPEHASCIWTKQPLMLLDGL